MILIGRTNSISMAGTPESYHIASGISTSRYILYTAANVGLHTNIYGRAQHVWYLGQAADGGCLTARTSNEELLGDVRVKYKACNFLQKLDWQRLTLCFGIFGDVRNALPFEGVDTVVVGSCFGQMLDQGLLMRRSATGLSIANLD